MHLFCPLGGCHWLGELKALDERMKKCVEGPQGGKRAGGTRGQKTENWRKLGTVTNYPVFLWSPAMMPLRMPTILNVLYRQWYPTSADRSLRPDAPRACRRAEPPMAARPAMHGARRVQRSRLSRRRQTVTNFEISFPLHFQSFPVPRIGVLRAPMLPSNRRCTHHQNPAALPALMPSYPSPNAPSPSSPWAPRLSAPTPPEP